VERVLGTGAAQVLAKAFLVVRLLLLVAKHLLRFVVGSIGIFLVGWLVARGVGALRTDLQAMISDNGSYFIYAAIGLWGLWGLKEVLHELNRHKTQDPSRAIPTASKEVIPVSVKHVVYYRDKGRCRRCWMASDLGYEHVIPLSHGGSNSANNVELLCGSCSAQPNANRYVYLEDRRLGSRRRGRKR
jgi:5-methylcytosine-specific restriction endonuclease McrA